MKELSQWYKDILEKYQQLIRIRDKEIERLQLGYQKRIKVFEQSMKEKALVVEEELTTEEELYII